MIEIPAGEFLMGSEGIGENYDEKSIHLVKIERPFKISETEITNAQYEMFDPEHKKYRGKDNISLRDNEPVTNVSWYDAMRFCEWLSKMENKSYRLPTESEWEYVCRAGTSTDYFTGDTLPELFYRNQVIARDYLPVDLSVKTTMANSWGIYEMHGNVEEWCLDWYGPYKTDTLVNPGGPSSGEFKVSRGGSHHTPVKYLRSSNRMGMLPDDRNSQIGFRIVESEDTLNFYQNPSVVPLNMSLVGQEMKDWMSERTVLPVFMPPIPYVIAPDPEDNNPFFRHNHQPAITWCDNGDLLAIWYSTNDENGREMVVVGSRLRNDGDQWDKASLFYKVPDRNMTGSSLLNDGNGRLIHINGVESSGDWQNLAMVMRESRDNGETWSKGRLIAPDHKKRHQVIAGPIITTSGILIQMCDAGPGGEDGSAIHLSHDGGKNWQDPYDSIIEIDNRSEVGRDVAGIHAGIVELNDGRLMALGRGNSIPDSSGNPKMPVSISSDLGMTWNYSPSEFPPIQGGQRLVLMRLREGPILLASFTGNNSSEDWGMNFMQPDGTVQKKYGLFVALSYDDGETWQVKKLLSDGIMRNLDGGAWTGDFEMDETHAEPAGYLAATQTPDGLIHLLSSRYHYRFNLPWIIK